MLLLTAGRQAGCWEVLIFLVEYWVAGWKVVEEKYVFVIDPRDGGFYRLSPI